MNTKIVKKLLDFDPVSKYVKYEIPWEYLQLKKEEQNMLGRGNFGEILTGCILSLLNDRSCL